MAREQTKDDKAKRESRIVGLAHAQGLFTDGETECGDLHDKNVMVSEGEDNGAYVRAWVWVSFEGTDLDKEPAED